MKLVYEVNGSDIEMMDLPIFHDGHALALDAQRIANQCDVGLSDVTLRFVEG